MRDLTGALLPVQKALTALGQGELAILTDGLAGGAYLVAPASLAGEQIINFMATHGRGLICLSLPASRVDALNLPGMPQRNRTVMGWPYTVSIEARHGITTGISAKERAHTILTAAQPQARPEDIVSPGHVFPLRAQEGPLGPQSGPPEVSVTLAHWAGQVPAAVICAILDDDGELAQGDTPMRRALRHIPRLSMTEALRAQAMLSAAVTTDTLIMEEGSA